MAKFLQIKTSLWNYLFRAMVITSVIMVVRRIIAHETLVKIGNNSYWSLDNLEKSNVTEDILEENVVDSVGSLSWSSSFEQDLKDRRKVLRDACKDLPIEKDINSVLRDRSLLKRFIVDDNTRTIFCYITKVASTNWFRVYMILTGISNATDKDLKSLEFVKVRHSFTDTELLMMEKNNDTLMWKLKTYTKIIAVRDPLQRLLSTYRSLVSKSHYLRYYLKKLRQTEHVTLPHWSEFIHYLTHGGTMNPHWKPYYQICLPCAIDYDFILHHENIVAEGNYLLRHINAPETLTFPNSSRFDSYTTDEVLESYMKKNVSQELINLLYAEYDTDYRLFGYKKIYQKW